MADYLTRQLADMAPHRAIVRAVECTLMAQVAWQPPVLDIGCGDGHFASIAYASQVDVGIDPMARDLAEAHSRKGVFRHLVRGSSTHLPFRDGAFGTVVSNSVLEHIVDVDAALHAIARVLRPATRSSPGGVLAVTVPSEYFAEFLGGSTLLRRAGASRLAEAYGRFFNRISVHHHVDPPPAWRDRFEAAGLSVERHLYYFSQAAHWRFDLCHYLGVPNLVTKRLLGRWVIVPGQMRLFERWLRRHYEEPLPEVGAYQFFVCRRS